MPEQINQALGQGIALLFPPEWSEVAVIETSNRMFMNKDHVIFKALSEDIWYEFHEKRKSWNYENYEIVAQLTSRSIRSD
jgi:hypothetical protein